MYSAGLEKRFGFVDIISYNSDVTLFAQTKGQAPRETSFCRVPSQT